MIEFYIDTVKHYLNLHKEATDPYSKKVWLEYAQHFLTKAEKEAKNATSMPNTEKR